MSTYDQSPNSSIRNRRTGRYGETEPVEPSMSAPSPLAGPPSQGYPTSMSYNQPPADTSAGNVPYTWQQGYTPSANTAIPPARGWSQSYQPVQENGWQQEYQQQGLWQQPYPQQPQQNSNAWQWNGNGYAPSPYGQQPEQQKQPGGAQMIIKLAAAAAAVITAVIVLVIALGNAREANALEQYVTAYENVFCQGVYVDGIHLGGMTYEQAQQTVQGQAQQRCDAWNIRLETPSDDPNAEPGKMEFVGSIDAALLGMTVDVNDALDAAWAMGHTGTTVEARRDEMDALLATPYYGSTAQPSGNTSAIDEFLAMLANAAYIAPVDAYLADFQPKNTNPFVIQPETYGRMLDVSSLKDEIYRMVETMQSGTLVVETSVIEPRVTYADLKESFALRGTAHTLISSVSTENRNLNIERACELINGTVIAPGKTFSFNDVVGPRNKKTGFHLAIEYAYGEQREGYGGGVCQVSSTIYVAAVRANMEIVKRTQHSDAVNYTTFGLDATVNFDGRKIDFVFRNNTDQNIYIITKVQKNPSISRSHYAVICSIYGPALPAGVTYDLAVTQMEVPAPTDIKLVPDEDGEYVLYTDEIKTVVKAEPGYEVDSFFVKYQDGKEVERIPAYHDSYAPVQQEDYVGINERPLGMLP